MNRKQQARIDKKKNVSIKAIRKALKETKDYRPKKYSPYAKPLTKEELKSYPKKRSIKGEKESREQINLCNNCIFTKYCKPKRPYLACLMQVKREEEKDFMRKGGGKP